MKLLVTFLAVLLSVCSVTAQSKRPTRPALPMSDMAVESILKAMKNQYDDYRKLEVIKGGIQNNADGISVSQELRLLNQFGTDEYKLACAKYLYPWCVDPKAYDKVVYNMASPDAQKTLKAFVAKNGK